MEFVFWQNVVSIHQSAFLKALSKDHLVTLVAAEYLDSQRKGDGWDIPSMGAANIIISPSEDEIRRLILKPGIEHIFSGINAYPMVYKAFREGVSNRVRISILVEPYDWNGFKGVLRRIKYYLLLKIYGTHINHIFATGHTGVQAYLKAGFPEYKLHHWGYFTEYRIIVDSNSTMTDIRPSKPSLLFVGRLDDNKNLMSVLNIYKDVEQYIDTFDIIGRGSLEDVIRKKAKCFSNIKIHGLLSNSDVQQMMSTHDYLILPSKYDGWGAVVNEALSQGMRVLCSRACGSEILIDGKERGEVFHLSELKETLIRWLKKGPISYITRTRIKKWANDKLSGTAAANYFVEIIEGKDSKAPWIE